MADAANSNTGFLGYGSGKTGLFGWGGSGFTAKGFGEVTGGIGGIIGGIQTAQGLRDEAGLYGVGADAAFQQADMAEVLGSLEEATAARRVSLTESSQRAAIAKNGLAEAGSAADLLRESVTQGHLTEQAINFSTELKADQYRRQGYAAQVQQKASQDAAGNAILGGVLKGVSSFASLALML